MLIFTQTRATKMRALAAIILMTGLCWFMIALASYANPNAGPSTSIAIELPFVVASIKFSWTQVLLSFWTSALFVFVLHLKLSGKMSKPDTSYGS